MTLTKRHFLINAAAFAALPSAVFAATPPVYAEDGIAIDGTDPVAYFTDSAPVKGSSDFSHTYNGAT